MYVQGLGLTSQTNSKSIGSVKTKKVVLSDKPLDSSKDKVELSSRIEIDREMLLQKIKSKIKSGYYNSDAVMEDLSHNFAKVLDETL
jgi:hypothetical protein